jgi:hypothetical protein
MMDDSWRTFSDQTGDRKTAIAASWPIWRFGKPVAADI